MNKPKELQTTTQIIAREGFKPVGVCVVLMLLFIFLHFEFLALFALICAIFCAFIFRNTERIAQYRGYDAIIAPCDGIIRDISFSDSTTAILFKINIFDSGIFRIPAYITRIKSAFRFGIFIKGFNDDDKKLQEILNTKHKIHGFAGDSHIFSITLLPEAWNKANIYAVSNSSLTQSLREFEKFSLDRRLALSRSNFSAQPTNLAQDTRIAKDSKNSSLRESRSDSWQSKSRESNKNGESMIEKQINTDSLQVRDSQNAQILPDRLPRFGITESRNDESSANYQDSQGKSTHPLTPSAREGESTTHSTIFIGDRLGFMKYGFLLLEIHAPCKLTADKGDNVFAGESLIGKIQANL